MIPVYSTHDIVLAATLKVMGYKLDQITVTGRQGYFHFIDVRESTLNDYDLDNSKVEPRAFNTAVRNLATAVKRMCEKDS